MKAMILAAGRGERMRPLTDEWPKPLLPAGGRPLIAWHLLRLAKAGIRDIVVNHAWLGHKLEAALGDGAALGVNIRYSPEADALETAGGIAQAMPLLVPQPQLAQEPFLLINGDVFCDFDFGRARTIALQMKLAKLACWCVMVPNPPHHREGDFRLAHGLLGSTASPDAPPQAQGASGRPEAVAAPGRLTYSGIGLYTPRMFEGIGPGRKAPLRPCLEREIAAGLAAGEYHGGLWFDIGTAQRLAELDQLLTTRSITVGA